MSNQPLVKATVLGDGVIVHGKRYHFLRMTQYKGWEVELYDIDVAERLNVFIGTTFVGVAVLQHFGA